MQINGDWDGHAQKYEMTKRARGERDGARDGKLWRDLIFDTKAPISGRFYRRLPRRDARLLASDSNPEVGGDHKAMEMSTRR